MVSKERCWTEIDLSALKENYVLLKNRIPTDCRLMSIVKAWVWPRRHSGRQGVS